MPRMAEVRPLFGLRYLSKAGPLERLIAPPMNTLRSETRRAYTERSPYNVVHVAYPDGDRDERSKFIRFARSGALYQEWRRDGVIAGDSPTMYRVEIFPEEGESVVGIFALVRLEDLETTAAPEESFLHLLEATRTWFEPAVVTGANFTPTTFASVCRSRGDGAVRVTDDHGNRFEFEEIEDPQEIADLQALLSTAELTVTEGAGRIAAAQTFAARKPSVPESEKWALVGIFPPMPTTPRHRIYPATVFNLIAEKLEAREVQSVHASHLRALPAGTVGIAREGGVGSIVPGIGAGDIDAWLGTAAVRNVSYSRNVNDVITASNTGSLGIVFSSETPMPDAWLSVPPPVGLVFWNMGDFI
jgi:hypothetical protein